jgi:hypothetical protein
MFCRTDVLTTKIDRLVRPVGTGNYSDCVIVLVTLDWGMDSNEGSSEVMVSTADVAKRLNVGSAMVRKWAIAYEDITGDKVRLKSKRDGREFSASQVDVIARAKRYVDREGVKIDTALKMALGQAELVPAVLDARAEDSGSLEVLQEFLARNDETNRLLLQEIRGLREDLKQGQLAAPAQTDDPAREIKNPQMVEATVGDETHHGIFTRLGARLDRLLRSK